MPDLAEKIVILRRRCRDRKAGHQCHSWAGGSPVAAAVSLRASAADASWRRRCGQRTRDLLTALPFAIGDLEPLGGRPDLAALAALPQVAQDEAWKFLERCPYPGGQSGHCELDRAPLFELGVDGLQARIRARQAAASDAETRETLESFVLALDGFAMMIEHAAAAAETAMTSAAVERRRELAEIAASCRGVAHQPPVSFLDALHLAWFMDLAVTHGDGAGLVGPGHLDRTLRRYYEADLERGRLTRDRALFLLEALYLLINEFVPDSLAMACMVGGRDAQGRDLTNDLSYLCLEALRRTRLVYPTVGVCWHEGTPPALTDLAVKLIADGIATPAFFGDETIQRGLRALGVPAAESCHYVNSTCVEITPSGSGNVWVASPYFSTCQILLDEIAAQAQAPNAPTFAAFVERYEARLGEQVRQAAAEQNALRQARFDTGGKPLQSVFTADCIARGRDLDRGGARYNWVECSFVGLANLADSLHVVRAELYEQSRLTFAALRGILAADFAGFEAERQRFLHGYPKYGNDCAAVDQLLGDIVGFASHACAGHRMKPDGSAFVPGAFCWIMHEQLGRQCGATPDGRRAGFPFADGCGPAQGREVCGPTSSILSTTSWDHSPMIGGLAYNMRFSSSLFAAPDARRRLGELVLTFLRRGGFEMQINVVDAALLRAAQANPEAHRDLVVRIGGYTDYFTRLSPQMQAEVLARTEYDHV